MISRNSSFSFKDTALTTVEISAKLNVRYLGEGSIRKGGNKVRISASLIDAEQDKQIWSDRWDRPMDDIFDVQDEISLTIARKVNPTICSKERAKSLPNPPPAPLLGIPASELWNYITKDPIRLKYTLYAIRPSPRTAILLMPMH